MKISAWIEAMRLRTLPVSLAGVAVAVGYTVLDGCFAAVPAVLCFVFAALCQVASNFANEYYDYKAGRDRAGREGFRRGVAEGDLSPRAMKGATFGTLVVAAVVGLCIAWFGGWWLIAAGALIGLGALGYSAGPYPFSTHCLGEVAVILFFGLVPVNLTYYVMAHQWSMEVFMASVSVGLMGANVLIVNNYRDIEDDRATGKHTLANTLPSWAMPVLYGLNAVVAAALMLGTWKAMGSWQYWVPDVYAACSILLAMKMRRSRGKELNPMLGTTAKLMGAYALIFLLGA